MEVPHEILAMFHLMADNSAERYVMSDKKTPRPQFSAETKAIETAPTVDPSTYRGWKTLALRNELIEVQVAPAIGGRVIQLKLGDFEFFFVCSDLAGKPPPPTGLDPQGAWLNYGGEKLWPAPQGWGEGDQWPGPPDAILDGSPHQGEILRLPSGTGIVRLTSQKDSRSGLQISRTLEAFAGSTRVRLCATMTNIDTRPRRWGIWSVAQQNGADRAGTGAEKKLRVYCPLNPESIYPDGYKVMFGLANNNSWLPDREQGMMRVHFQRRVGKIGLDSSAGWVATVNGSAGKVFVQRFEFLSDREYPDDASVEIWLQGLGQFIVDGKLIELEDNLKDSPFLIETELLGPLTRLEPGASSDFTYDWYATTVGGDHPVVDCTRAGVTCQELLATRSEGTITLAGLFGVFYVGTVRAVFQDANGEPIGLPVGNWAASPLHAFTPSGEVPLSVPTGARTISLDLFDRSGRDVGVLARTELP